MAHESNDLDILICRIRTVDESGTSINIISPQGVYHRLDWIESALVQDQISRENVYYQETIG